MNRIFSFFFRYALTLTTLACGLGLCLFCDTARMPVMILMSACLGVCSRQDERNRHIGWSGFVSLLAVLFLSWMFYPMPFDERIQGAVSMSFAWLLVVSGRMGYADAVCLGVFGVCLGMQRSLLLVILAVIIALAWQMFHRKERLIPFASCLMPAFLIVQSHGFAITESLFRILAA